MSQVCKKSGFNPLMRMAVMITGVVGIGVFSASAAFAATANPAIITVTYGGSGNVVSSTTITGNVGDTFTLENDRNQDNGPSFVSLVNGTGTVSMGATNCTTDSSCTVLDSTGAHNSAVFTITGLGTITARRYLYSGGSGVYSTINTITISASGGGSSGSTISDDPATVYPSATLYVQGDCGSKRVLQFVKRDGANAMITLPTNAQCFSRDGSTLTGWTNQQPQAAPRGASLQTFAPGQQIPIGDESFSLWAIWKPHGVRITYDSNVALADQCVDDTGTNLPLALLRSFMVTVDPSANLASAPSCHPKDPQNVFAGWKINNTGALYAPGARLNSGTTTFAGGDEVRMSAVWQPTRTLTCQQGRAGLVRPPASLLITQQCGTDFGFVPVGWTAIIPSAWRNNATMPLSINVSVNGTHSEDVRVLPTSTCGPVQSPGSTCQVNLAWTPQQTGDVSFNVVVQVNNFAQGRINTTYSGTAFLPKAGHLPPVTEAGGAKSAVR